MVINRKIEYALELELDGSDNTKDVQDQRTWLLQAAGGLDLGTGVAEAWTGQRLNRD